MQATSPNFTSTTTGVQKITADYLGDSNFSVSDSAPLSETFNPYTSTTSIVSSLNPTTVGQGVTFTATITPQSGAIVAPTGTVQFYDGVIKIGAPVPVALVGGVYQATSPTDSWPAPGTHLISAVYSGDANFAGSNDTATPLSEIVNPGATATLVSPSLNPTTIGKSVTFTAIILPSGGASGTPTGTVQFYVAGSPVGSPVTLVTVGGFAQATYTTSWATAGTYAVTAYYSGDANFSSSDNITTPVEEVVNKGTTTTSIVPSLNPIVVGQKVTFTASVVPTAGEPGTPTGMVQFYVNGTAVGSPKTLAVVGGVAEATYTGSFATPGTRMITAVYLGDSNFLTSNDTATPLSEKVNKGATTTALASSLNPATVGQNVTFTATVSPTGGASGTPTGTVQFYIAGSPVGSPVTLTVVGGVAQAKYTTSFATSVVYSITAVYSGDGNFNTSNNNSDPLLETVNATTQPVNLSSYFNLTGITTNGTKCTTGLDGAGIRCLSLRSVQA